MIFTVAMWTHALLNAIVVYEPTPPPHEWIGELRVCRAVITTLAVWCAAWQVGFA